MRRILFFTCLAYHAFSTYAQTVILSPCQSPSPEQEVTITFDASGTSLEGETKVYAHAGVVITDTNSPTSNDWTAVKGNWGQDNGVGLMTQVPGQPNKWSLVLGPTLRSYFNTLSPSNAPIFWLAVVFRNANGSKQTSPDIFIRLNKSIALTQPQQREIFIPSGNSIPITASLCSTASLIKVSVNEGAGFVDVGEPVSNANSITVNFLPTGSGQKIIRITATIAGSDQFLEETLTVFNQPPVVIAPLPPSIKRGINYYNDNPTTVTLVLETPIEKDFVYVAGDFNNWQANDAYFMKKTPDGKFFWLTITDLIGGQEYVFQYWVDGSVKIGDPYAEKVADPWNDPFIPASTYPNLPAYTKTEYGIATVLQTNQESYNWSANELIWQAPPKDQLIIYELLLRDFLGTRRYRDLADSLSYLKRLGINAIELMPIMEFEGNLSWGYNPSYFFAPDKFYGTKDDFKYLVDKAHQEGIAIILDIALNHAFGQCPLVQLYANGGQPAENNPWFNVVAKHPFNVGYDFNHESIYTQQFADSVIRFWIEEYHIDGYRFDLSKGFTQRFSNTVNEWNVYDQSRIDIWKRISSKIWSYKADAYIILEHFGGDSEENVLANEGMLLWKRLDESYAALLKGNTATVITGADSRTRVTYMESHDEERLGYELRTGGQQSGGYNIRTVKTMLDRIKLGAAFFYTLPGPKMLWQFQELGYDKSINTCTNGSVNSSCRLDNKPLPWGTTGLGYYEDADRQRLYKAMSALFKLINTNREVFTTGNVLWQPSGDTRRINISHSFMDVAILGNFSTSSRSASANFSKTGTWYDYFSGLPYEVTDRQQPIALNPGRFYIFTSIPQPIPEGELVVGLEESILLNQAIEIYPNPAKESLLVSTTEQFHGPVTIHIYNVHGKIFYHRELLGFSTETIETSQFPSGMYLLKINSGRGIVTQKVIIQNN